MIKNILMITLLLAITLTSGCSKKQVYNSNGWSIWGWSKESQDHNIHIGFVGTDIFMSNADKERCFYDNDEKQRLEIEIADELGFGAVGGYYEKKF
jgi:hypothetical protein